MATASSSSSKQADKRPRSIFDLPSNFFDSSCLLPPVKLLQFQPHPPSSSIPLIEEQVHATANSIANINFNSMNRLSCNTCKSEFESLLDQRSHFKSDLHCFNVGYTLGAFKIQEYCSILNKLTPEKYDLLKGQLIDSVDSGITSAEILKGVVALIFENAVLEPTLCPMYAQLCSDLNENLPSYPPEEDGGKPVTFKRVLLNICQMVFEGADNLRAKLREMKSPEQESKHRDEERLLKLRALGNIRLIGELLKQNIVPEKIVHHIVRELLGPDSKSCLEEETVEAIYLLFITIGKQLDERPASRRINDIYFIRLKELSTHGGLSPRLRFIVRNVLALRSNNWVPRRGEEIMVNCQCGIPVATGTSWTSENPGRKFRGCKFYNHETGYRGCNSFEWVDEDPTEWQCDVINVLVAEKHRLATDNHILNMRLVCAEHEKKRLEEEELKRKKSKRIDLSPNVIVEMSQVGIKLLVLCIVVSTAISAIVVKLFN